MAEAKKEEKIEEPVGKKEENLKVEEKKTPEKIEGDEEIEEVDGEDEEIEEEVEEPNNNEGIFITEADVFDVNIKWYRNGDKLLVEDIDEDFDNAAKEVSTFTVTFKYPSQGDYEIIMNSIAFKAPDEMKVSDIVQMELTRLVTLVRKWDLKQDITRMVELDPNIVKAMLKKVRDVISMKGIL